MTDSTGAAEPKSSQGGRRLLLFAVVVLGLFVAGRVLPLAEWLGQTRTWIRDLGPWGPAAFVSIYVLATVLAMPGTPLTVAAGALFGGFWGTVWVSVASTIGASLAFLIARYVARDAIVDWLGDKAAFQRLERLTARRAALVVLITRLLPIFPFNLLNFGFGLTNTPFLTYIAVSWIAMLPGTILYVVGTQVVTDAISAGEIPWRAVAAVVGVLILLAALAPRLRRRLAELEGAAS